MEQDGQRLPAFAHTQGYASPHTIHTEEKYTTIPTTRHQACVSTCSQQAYVSTQSDVCTAYSWSLLGEVLSVGGGSGSLFSLCPLHSHLRIATENIHFCSELAVAAALGNCECDT